MKPFDFQLRTRVVFGEGSFERLGELALELGFTRTLIVSDPGMSVAGYVGRAVALLRGAGLAAFTFQEFESNPDGTMIERGRAQAAAHGIDSIVALGGGSSLDCAKGINFVLTNGGAVADYRGFGKASSAMLPMIGVPTTAGTGSDAQSYAILSDAVTHQKMACGDPKAAFRIAILDPVLTLSQPRSLTAVAGFDALSHAAESYVTTRRSGISDVFAREAWRQLEGHYERVLAAPDDLAARGAMLVGAHSAGLAIELSMLGAAHACANPLTARHGMTHGVAIGVMLPHVVRWNAEYVGDRYAELLRMSADGIGRRDDGREVGGDGGGAAGERLAARLDELARAGGLPRTLSELGVARDGLPALAADAAMQWTGTFNPRPFTAAAALELYERAY